MDRFERGAFDRLLDAENLSNTQRLNVLRLIGGAGFLILEWLPWQRIDQHMEKLPLILLCFYVTTALAIVLVGRKSAAVARMSRLALPFLDIPTVFVIQHFNLYLAEAPRALGNFTLAVFVSYLMLAALSLERWQLALAAIIAVILQFVLHLEAGETLYGMIGGAFLLIGVATLSDFSRQRRTKMVWALCGQQLRRERLGRYFSPFVAAEIEKTGEGVSSAQQCEVTVIFTDLRDFTTLAEHLETSKIVTLLNDYFEQMVAIVFEYGGTLDKYIGDGLMIYFGAPIAQGDHATRAVRCALAMQESLVRYNSVRPDQIPLRMGIGIHTGTAVVGSIGALHRREYTVIGDTVNLAARIEQLCKPSKEEILVSFATKHLTDSAVTFREVMECVVKGRTSPVRIFAPM